jgi:prolyl 4-hydroxylase
MRPLVFRMESFLSPEEISSIVRKAAPEMKASPVSLMDKDLGKSATEFRTSQQVFLSAKGSALLLNLESRISNLTGCPTNQQETIQVLKYESGQYYLPHLDYWDPGATPIPPPRLMLCSVYYQSPSEVKRSQAGHKNRLSTVFWYLSDCDGGHTAFPLAPILRPHVSGFFPEPDADPNRPFFHPGSPENHLAHTLSCEYSLRIPPKVGSAILFYSILPNGLGDQYSQHAACAVKNGTKWAANKWVWNKPL